MKQAVQSKQMSERRERASGPVLTFRFLAIPVHSSSHAFHSHRLDVSVELSGDFEAHFQENDVHERASRCSEGLFANDAGDEFAIFDQDFGIGHGQPLERTTILRVVVGRVSSEVEWGQRSMWAHRETPARLTDVNMYSIQRSSIYPF